jgi:predicted porin
LRRTGDLTDFPLSPGDSEQRGGQVALSFRWTPVVSFEGAYQFGRTQGLGFDANKLSRDSVLSLGSNFAISKQTRVSAAVQHQDLKVSGSVVRVNRATVGLTHRF